jgi:hypothetical protein
VPGGHDADNSPNWMSQTRSRLALRRSEKPATKAGQIRALWPDIDAALAVGQSMKTICAWLAEDAGITLGVTSLTSYISRIRRREKANRHSEVPLAQLTRPDFGPFPTLLRELDPSRIPATRARQPPDDPLAQAMRVLSRPKMDIRKIHNDGDPEGGNLI